MANYKRITDVESVTSTTETMNVLVEDGGALKKIPAAQVGGGSGVYFLALLDGDEDYNHTCSFVNMTYDQLRSALEAYIAIPALLGCKNYDDETYHYDNSLYRFLNNEDNIRVEFDYGSTAIICYSDGTIEVYQEMNG